MFLSGSEIETFKSPQSNEEMNRTRNQRDSRPQSSMRGRQEGVGTMSRSLAATVLLDPTAGEVFE